MSTCINWIITHKNHRTTFGKKTPTDTRLEIIKKKQNVEALCTSQSDYESMLMKIPVTQFDTLYIDKLNEFLEKHKIKADGNTEKMHIDSYAGSLLKERKEAPDITAFAEAKEDDFNNIKNFLTATHRYHLINFKGLHAHTICCYMSGGKIFGSGSHLYVFDPNIGEFKVPLSEVGYFLSLLVFTHISMGARNNTLTAYRIE